MDGGRITLAILSRHFSRSKAMKITKIFGVVISVLLVLAFVITTFFAVNYTILTLGIFCFFTAIWDDKNCLYERAHFLSNKNFGLKKGLLVREVAVIEDTTLYNLVKEIRQDSITNFCVLNKKMEKVGYVEEKQIEKYVQTYPATATLKTILN